MIKTAWDDTKSTGDTLTATEWNNQANDQKDRTNFAYTVFKDGATYYARANDASGTDYSGASFSTVLQAAITALSSGGAIMIRAGTYSVDAKISFDANGQHLYGEGLLTMLEQAVEDTMIQIEDIEFCGLHDLRLRGVKATYIANTNRGLYINTTAYDQDLQHVIENVYIDNFAGDGVLISGDSREVRLYNVTVGGCGLEGFHIYGGNHRVVGCVSGSNTYSGFSLLDGDSTYTGISAWSNSLYGVYLHTTANALHIDAECYDNSKAALCLEDVGGTEYPRFCDIHGTFIDSMRGIYIKGGKKNRFSGLIANTTGNSQQTGVLIDGGDDNQFNVMSISNTTLNYKISSGTYELLDYGRSVNSGKITLLSGNLSAAVTHNLDVGDSSGALSAPSAVTITPVAYGTGIPPRFWVSSVDNAAFNIKLSSTQASNMDFYWRAEI